MGNYTMHVSFFGNDVRCETENSRLSLTDLVKAGNLYRMMNGQSFKPLAQLLESAGFKEFLKVAEKNLGKTDLISVEGRGNEKRTMAHYIIGVYVAEQYSTEFHFKVIQTFIEGKLLEFRDLGGTEFKTLNASIDLYLPGREDKDNKGVYIQCAMRLRTKILGDSTRNWNEASVEQTHTRYDFERRLCDYLRMGMVRDYDHLKEIIEKL